MKTPTDVPGVEKSFPQPLFWWWFHGRCLTLPPMSWRNLAQQYFSKGCIVLPDSVIYGVPQSRRLFISRLRDISANKGYLYRCTQPVHCWQSSVSMVLGRPEFGAIPANERYSFTPVSIFTFVLSRLVSLFVFFLLLTFVLLRSSLAPSCPVFGIIFVSHRVSPRLEHVARWLVAMILPWTAVDAKTDSLNIG